MNRAVMSVSERIRRDTESSVYEFLIMKGEIIMMKRVLIISLLTAVLLTGVGTVAVFAGSVGVENNEIYDSVVPTSNVRENSAEASARERIREESNQLFGEFYEEEAATGNYQSNHSNEFEDLAMDSNLLAAANGKLIKAQTDEVIDIINKYGHMTESISYDDIDTIEKYADLAIMCCETYNDLNIELTMDERIRLQNYLQRAYENLVDLSVEQTDKTMTAYELIEDTITLKYGISQTVERR